MTEEVALNVKFTGDSSGVVTESRRAADSVDEYGSKVDRSTERTHKFSRANADAQRSLKAMGAEMLSVAKAAGVAAAAVGTAAVVALAKVTKDGLESADALAKTADKLGVATEKIAAYSLAAKDTGVSQDQLFSAIQRTSKVLVDAAAGSETAAKAIAALGLEAEALLALTPDQAFERIADSIASIEDPALKSALAIKVFGRSGGELLNFINLGSDGLEEVARKAELAGIALSRDMVAKVEMANDSMELLGVAMDGFGQQVAVKVAPLLLELGDRVFATVEAMGGMGAVADEVVEGLVSGAGSIVTAWEFVSTGLYSLEAIMRSVNVVAATTIDFALKGAAALTGLHTSLGQEMWKLADSFGRQADEQAKARDRAWSAAAESAQNYGKTEERLKTLLAEVTAAADERAAVMEQVVKSTEEAAVSSEEAADSEERRSKVINTLTSEQNKAAVSTGIFSKATKELDQFSKDLIESVRAEAEALKGLTDLMDEGKRLTEQLRTPTEVFADEQERLNQMLDAGAISQETYNRAVQKATSDLLEKNAQAAQQASTAWQDFGLAVQDAFRDTFIRAGDDLDDFLKRAEDALKEAARRWLFDSTIGRLFAGFGGAGFAGGATASTGATGTAAGGGLTSLGQYANLLGSGGGGTGTGASLFLRGANSLLNGGATYVGQTLNQLGYTTAANQFGTAYANTAILGNNVGQMFGLQNGGALVGGAVTAGAGVAGGYVGNILGEGIFDKKAESNIGSTAGGIAGAYIGAQYGSTFGPWGAAIGAAIGALADVAFGGDGKKRSNTGAIVGPTVTGGQVAASGLRIAPYERRGDQGAANQLANALVQLDGALTQITESLGVDVNFSGRALQGVNPDAGHDGPGIFFGAKGFNGATGFADAPDEFVKAWLAEVNGLLPARVKMIMEGVDGAAEALVTGFAAAVQIDNLLNLDVVKDTKAAIDELLTPQKILLELYDDTTEKVMALAAGIDGNAEGLTQLSEALREQKTAALELALAYQGVQLETTALFGGAIDDIRHALMSEEELYNERRGQIADLTEQLRTAISPDEISRLNQQIVGLTNEAFRSLDSGQQQTLGQEFLGFLNEAQRISEEQLAAGLASLASREEGIERTIELELSVAQQQQQAATTLQTATDRFGGWVDRLTSGQTTITINVPGYGQFNVPLGLDIATEITL